MFRLVSGRMRATPRNRQALALAALFGFASAAPAAATPEIDAARASVERVGQRMERLRNPSFDAPRVDVNLRFERNEDERQTDDRLNRFPDSPDTRFDPGRFEARPLPSNEMSVRTGGVPLDGFGFWSRGRADLAREGRGSVDIEGSTASVSTGYDWGRPGGGIAGVSLSLDRRRFGDDDVGTLVGVAGYRSYQTSRSSFMDVIGGTVHQEDGSGESLTFGSATVGMEYRPAGWLVSPYGRAEVFGADAQEASDAMTGKIVAGFRTERTVEIYGRRLRPQLRWEIEHDRQPGRPDVQRFHTVTPALFMEIAPDWNARVEHRSVVRDTGHSGRLDVKVTGKF